MTGFQLSVIILIKMYTPISKGYEVNRPGRCQFHFLQGRAIGFNVVYLHAINP